MFFPVVLDLPLSVKGLKIGCDETMLDFGSSFLAVSLLAWVDLVWSMVGFVGSGDWVCDGTDTDAIAWDVGVIAWDCSGIGESDDVGTDPDACDIARDEFETSSFFIKLSNESVDPGRLSLSFGSSMIGEYVRLATANISDCVPSFESVNTFKLSSFVGTFSSTCFCSLVCSCFGSPPVSI